MSEPDAAALEGGVADATGTGDAAGGDGTGSWLLGFVTDTLAGAAAAEPTDEYGDQADGQPGPGLVLEPESCEAEPRPEAEVVSVTRGTHADLLLDRELDLASVGRYLFVIGTPPGVEIGIDLGAEASYQVTGLTTAAMPWIYDDIIGLVSWLVNEEEWDTAASRPVAAVLNVTRSNAGRTASVTLDRELDVTDVERFLFARPNEVDFELEIDMGTGASYLVTGLTSYVLDAMFDDVADWVRAAPLTDPDRSGTESAEAWISLKKAAAGIADDRLQKRQLLLYQAVDMWSDRNESKIEGVKGPSESGLGMGLFTVFTEAAAVLFMPQTLLMTLAVEATKAYYQALVTGINEASAATAGETFDSAREQLQGVVDKLKEVATTKATEAWQTASGNIDDDLDKLFAAFPEYADMSFGGNARPSSSSATRSASRTRSAATPGRRSSRSSRTSSTPSSSKSPARPTGRHGHIARRCSTCSR